MSPLVSEMIRNQRKHWERRDWTKIPTYRIMMETQVAHEIAELSILKGRTSEHRVELMKAWEEGLTLGGTKDRSKTEKKETMTDLIDSMVLLSCQVSALVDSFLFEEVANFVARRKEVMVTNMVVVTSRKFGLTMMNLHRNQDYVISKRTRGWSCKLSSSRSCLERARRASVSSEVRNPGITR